MYIMYIKYFHNKKETPYNVFLFSISKTVTFPFQLNNPFRFDKIPIFFP